MPAAPAARATKEIASEKNIAGEKTVKRYITHIMQHVGAEVVRAEAADLKPR